MALGLYAEFLRPPEIDGDSATVELVATGCGDGSAFEQVHRFRLELREGRWVVVERSRISIT